MLAAVASLVAAVPWALAAPYPIEIHVQSEEDIEQLYHDGEIDEETRDRLVTLFLGRVDLNLASRDEICELPGFTYGMADAVIAAREKLGRFTSPAELAAVAGVTPDVYEQALPFVTVHGAPKAKRYEAEVKAGAIGRTQKDSPSSYLRLRSRLHGHGGVGMLLFVRPMIGTVRGADPGESLSASAEALRFDPAAFHVFWDSPRLSAIAGSYRVGFGLGLTIDNSRRYLPHGWYPSVETVESNVSGRAVPLDGFMGLALRHKQIGLGRGWLDLSLFGSWWNRDLYYTSVYYDRCPPGQPGCSDSRKVPFIIDEKVTVDETTGQDTHRSLYCDFPTLPRILRELIGGANATYWLDRRNQIGLTGYVGNWSMRVDAPNIRPALSARYPHDRSTAAAIGLNTRLGIGTFDVAAEAALTDRGAPGFLVKGWLEPWANLQLVPSFRYYSPSFDNPYARGEADADQYLGLRARDEVGGRLQINLRPLPRLRLRADIDVWWHRYPGVRCDLAVEDSEDPRYCADYIGVDVDAGPRPAFDLEASLRARLQLSGKEWISVWVVYHDEDLSRGGRELSYSYYKSGQGDFSGGAKVYWAASAATTRIPRVIVSAMFKQIFEDTYQLSSSFDHSWYAWLRISAQLAPGPWLVARVKYHDQSTTTDPDPSSSQRCDYWEPGTVFPDELPGECRGESYWSTYLQLTQRVSWRHVAGSYLRVRFEWAHWTDHRAKWRTGTTCQPDPSRDELLVKGYLLVKF